MDDKPFDPFLRKSQILADLGVHSSTLDHWIECGTFPEPRVLNEGQKREIVAWLQSDYLQWKAARPQRRAKPITANAYSETARAKRRSTLAKQRASNGGSATTEPVAEHRDAAPPAPEPPRPRIARPRTSPHTPTIGSHRR